MKHYIVYNAEGRVLRYGYCQDDGINNEAVDGEFVMEGIGSEFHYVENGQIVPMPEKPIGFYIFDYASKEWIFDDQAARANAIFMRDQLLKDGPDRISPIWWDSMTEDQKVAWLAYRDALLNVPDQPNYPREISWPIKP